MSKTTYSAFKSREEVDAWYQETITGIGRALALESLDNPSPLQGHFRMSLDSVNHLYAQTYRNLGHSEAPPIVDIRELAHRIVR